MKRAIRRALLVVLSVPLTVVSQTTINGGRIVVGGWDASGAGWTKPAKAGTTLPATCAAGEVFFKTDAIAGQNLYGCTTANVWTLQAGGGAVASVFGRTGAVTAQAGDYAGVYAATAHDHPGGISGNAATATALASNGADCAAGQAARGVDAQGNAEGCFVPAGAQNAVTAAATLGDGKVVVGSGGARGVAESNLNGVARLTGGTLGVVSGSATDCVRVDGSSGACGGGAAAIAKDLNIDAPSAVDSNKYQLTFPAAVTLSRVHCSTDQGTVSINLDVRAIATPNTPGTDVLSAALACDNDSQSSCASGCDVNTIAAGSVAAHVPVNLQITATGSSPNIVRIHLEAQ